MSLTHPCFFRDTYVERKPGESPNDRNDRAIRVATSWYTTHLSASQPKAKNKHISMVLLTDDADNCQKAKAEGLIASTGMFKRLCIYVPAAKFPFNLRVSFFPFRLNFSVSDYVSSLEDAPTLLDKVSKRDVSFEGGAKEPLFPLHLSPKEIQDRLKAGKLHQGTFLASRENFLEGSVNVEGFEKFVSIRITQISKKFANLQSFSPEIHIVKLILFLWLDPCPRSCWLEQGSGWGHCGTGTLA